MLPSMLLFLILSAAPSEPAGGGPSAKPAALQKQWTERRFDAIERALRESCTGDAAAFEAQFDGYFRNVQAWESDQAVLDQWRRQAPDSLAGALVEAIYWRAYASQLRLGAVGHLPKEAMAFYREQLGRGTARLQQVKAKYDPRNLFSRNQNIVPAT